MASSTLFGDRWREHTYDAESGRDAVLLAIGTRDLDYFIDRAGIETVPVDTEQGRIARDDFRRFGKGRHRAGLNYGDCFSYALAMVTAEPRLFKGDDFGHTDIAIM